MNEPFQQRTDSASAFITSFHSDIEASPSSSSQSLSSSLAQHLQFNLLNKLREVHYVPYSTSNSLTIYSYVLWTKQNQVLVATKEQNFKEIYFRHVQNEIESKTCLEPCVKTHRLQRSSDSKQSQANTVSYVSSMDIIDLGDFCVLCATYVIVSTSTYTENLLFFSLNIST
jgi:hypothetical protein